MGDNEGRNWGSAADMLMALSQGGFSISETHKQVLRQSGREVPDEKATPGKSEEEQQFGPGDSRGHLWLYTVPVSRKTGKPSEGICYYDKIPSEWKEKWKDRPIGFDDWFLKDAASCKEFRKFILSGIPRFDKLIAYEPFYLYCEQARRWNEQTMAHDFGDHPDAGSRLYFVKEEGRRMRFSKLYGANRYGYVKEDNLPGGRRKYAASTPQALLAFLMDMKVHEVLLKGRQAAITSSQMLFANFEMILKPSYSGVFVVHKKDGSGKKIFRDKHQRGIQYFPKWLTQELDVSKGFATERTILDFNPGKGKMDKLKDASWFTLLSSEDSVVLNGQTPTQSFFDEAPMISGLQKLIGEIDPTLYQLNPETGELELVRNIYVWGTGSSNNATDGAFESLFSSTLDAFTSGKDTGAWVPLFFDWTCRPGITRDFYVKQKQTYMRGMNDETKGLTEKERLSLFNAHYPSEPADAFLSAHKTLYPSELIKKQKRRIMDECHGRGLEPRPVRFHPVFDETTPLPKGAYWPFKCKGATVEFLDPDDETAPAMMLFDRKPNFANRYFQGTDPIQNDGGFSRFSSVIRDRAAHRSVLDGQSITTPCPAVCVLNHRSAFPEEVFAQCVLMGMYYANHGQHACMELVEINAGKAYVDFKSGPDFDLSSSLVLRAALPQVYRGGNHVYGIDLKGGRNSRKEYLYYDITKLLREEGHNLWYYSIWSQVQNIAVSSKPDGSVQWGTVSKNTVNDDMVYGLAYAEVCDRSMFDREVKEINVDAPEMMEVVHRKRNPVTQEIYYTKERVAAIY